MAAGDPTSKTDYGLDAPLIFRRVVGRGIWTLVIGAVLYFVNQQQNPGPAKALLGVLAITASLFFLAAGIMYWSSRVAKLKVRDRLIEALALDGDEKILDAGCGRGLMLIGAAKRLRSGRALGVDAWNPQDLSGNSADAVKQNAKIEGVADKVRVETGDIRKLGSSDNQYDVVMSGLAIHNISGSTGREAAVREMYRVLKPGGKLLIFDIFYAARYAEILKDCGADDVALSSLGFLWCLPTRSVMARK